MANYASLKTFYESFKDELSSGDFESSEEEAPITPDLEIKKEKVVKNYKSIFIKKAPGFEFVEVKLKTPVKAPTKPITISISSEDESTSSTSRRTSKFKSERVGVIKKLMNKNQLPPKKIDSGKVVHQEFTRSQRGRLIRKYNKGGYEDDYEF